MDVGIFIFPQYIKKEEINQILENLTNYSISQIHVSFNYSSLLENKPNQDVLFFKPDNSYYQIDNKLLQYSRENWNIFQKFIESANKSGFKIIAWLNCLENQNILLKYPDWAQVNHIGEKSKRFLCPNNLSVQKYFSSLIKNIIEKYPVQGIELFNARFPFPYKEELCCFCESCEREATKPRALEDLKEREIVDESWKGFSIKQLRKYFIKNSHLLSEKTLGEDSVFQSWNRFRYNSITRFVGNILISARQTDQNISLGTDIWPISKAELIGQNYADLATYQDLIYQILFMKDKHFQKYTEIIKEINELKKLIKKARGLKKFYTCISLDEQIQKNEFQRIINATKQIGVKGIVFFHYKKEFELRLEIISEFLKNS